MTSIPCCPIHCPRCYSRHTTEIDHSSTDHTEPGVTRVRTYRHLACTECRWRSRARLVDDTLYPGEQLALGGG